MLKCMLITAEVVAHAMCMPFIDDLVALNVSSSCTIVYKCCYFRTKFRTKGFGTVNIYL
jgi:hypothetical protein